LPSPGHDGMFERLADRFWFGDREKITNVIAPPSSGGVARCNTA
jgi:hypothetical protein